MNKVVKQIATEKIVEEIVKNIAKDSTDEDLPDLIQDIYLTLLEKDEEWLQGIYDRGQINYFISRIVKNNINSKTSRWYYIYKMKKKRTDRIDNGATAYEKGERTKYDTD